MSQSSSASRRSTEVDGSPGTIFNGRVPDLIQKASSGRAKCRGCGQTIAGGELRFGESLPNAYGEGEAMHWLHLVCAACMRPEKFLPVLEVSADELPERAWLYATATFGVAHHRLPRLARAERAASGRARCRSCQEPVDKGCWRLALHMFEEGRFSPIGTIHVECAEAYFGTIEILDRIERLTPELDGAALSEIAGLLRTPRPRPAQDEASTPGLAKTAPEEEKPTGRRVRS
jgi:hypothetical protein